MITLDEVKHIANLARLEINDAEAVEYSEQLSAVLQHFEKLSKVDTTGVEALRTPSPIENSPRQDEVKVYTKAEEILETAPEKDGNLFKVPPVV